MSSTLASTATERAGSDARFLSVLLGAAGALHFAVPRPFDSIVPPALPGSARTYTLVSGAAELAAAALLAAPATRRAGGWAAAALFVAVFPANVQMAWDWRRKPAAVQAISLGRLPLQVRLVRRALRVAAGG